MVMFNKHTYILPWELRKHETIVIVLERITEFVNHDDGSDKLIRLIKRNYNDILCLRNVVTSLQEHKTDI